MNREEVKILLKEIKEDNISIDEGVDKLSKLSIDDLGYAKVDNSRELRVGYPEVIYCEGKTVEQVVGIFTSIANRGNNVLGTKATKEMYIAVKDIFPNSIYNETARTITLKIKEPKLSDTYIAIVTAGTSDIPVAEEAVVTAEMLGNKVEKIFDVGVAGIHRLFNKLDIIRGAKVIIVIAGMEGALASVIGGLVEKPIIAVPTSVGYGANFGGLSALLSMLNSCASGVGVVNIDNGFGAAYLASIINNL